MTIKRLSTKPVLVLNELPPIWRRDCNGKVYELDGVHLMSGTLMCWLREIDSDRGLHLPVKTVLHRFTPGEIKSRNALN